jgi:hypothetical protein
MSWTRDRAAGLSSHYLYRGLRDTEMLPKFVEFPSQLFHYSVHAANSYNAFSPYCFTQTGGIPPTPCKPKVESTLSFLNDLGSRVTLQSSDVYDDRGTGLPLCGALGFRSYTYPDGTSVRMTPYNTFNGIYHHYATAVDATAAQVALASMKADEGALSAVWWSDCTTRPVPSLGATDLTYRLT